jgi:predicted nuclease with RNAse H fold
MNVVVGIDVGGPRKGYHGVALRDGHYWDQKESSSALVMVEWCQQVGARAVGVDAPCRWSATGRARPAERALAAAKIHAFATPSRAAAEARPFYHWMVNGAELYRLLEKYYRLFDGGAEANSSVCFETFPQAVACALAGKIVSAKQKTTIRRQLLRCVGIDTEPLRNIDTVDAALCAFTAHAFLCGAHETYGDAVEGFIVVPSESLCGGNDL